MIKVEGNVKIITRAGAQKTSSLMHLMKCDGCDEETEVVQEEIKCWKCKEALGARPTNRNKKWRIDKKLQFYEFLEFK